MIVFKHGNVITWIYNDHSEISRLEFEVIGVERKWIVLDIQSYEILTAWVLMLTQGVKYCRGVSFWSVVSQFLKPTFAGIDWQVLPLLAYTGAACSLQ